MASGTSLSPRGVSGSSPTVSAGGPPPPFSGSTPPAGTGSSSPPPPRGTPPAAPAVYPRLVLLARVEEAVTCDGVRYELGTNDYGGALHPRGFEHADAFV